MHGAGKMRSLLNVIYKIKTRRQIISVVAETKWAEFKPKFGVSNRGSGQKQSNALFFLRKLSDFRHFELFFSLKQL